MAEDAHSRLAAIVDSSDDAIITKSLDGIIESWNSGAQRMFGYSEQEAIGHPITIIIPPELREQEVSILRRLAAGERISHYETVRVTKDGRHVAVSLSISPIRNSEGMIIGATKIARDITEKKQAEAAVQKNEDLFRLIANTVPVMIWMSGVDKLSIYANQPTSEFLGRPVEEVLGERWMEHIHPEDLARSTEAYGTAFDQRKAFQMEYRIRRRDGEYRWVISSGVPRFNADGSFTGYIGTAIDVTERKLAEETVRKSEERFRLASKTGKMFAYEWDAATDAIVRSGETTDILGVDETTPVTGAQVISKVHPDDLERLKAAVANLHPEKPHLQITYRMVRPDGTTIWVERVSRAYFGEQGKMLRVVGMVADITERKRAEEALSTVSRRLIEAHEEERTRIARELHDDINQQLALLAVSLEGVEQNSNASAAELRGEIRQAVKQLQELGSDVQAMSHRLHSSKLDYLGLAPASAAFCRELSRRPGIKINFQSENVPKELPKDISLCLFRVLQEGLQNAIKHSDSREFQVLLHAGAGEIELIVRDNGVGFDPEEAMKGSGLGLTSMKERLKLVNGTLSIDSRRERGTTIHARAPLTTRAKSAASGPG